MRMSKGLQLAMRLSNISVTALALEIYDLTIKHQEYENLTDDEKFIVGLRYSEFYTDTNDYAIAADKQQQLLNSIGIDKNELFEEVDRLFYESKNA